MFGSRSIRFHRRAYSLLALLVAGLSSACDSSDAVGVRSDTVVLEGRVASVGSPSGAPAMVAGVGLLGGIEVSVEGGTATTVTDDQGNFRLEIESEDANTVVLRFRRALLDVRLEIAGVTPGSTIRLAVSLSGESGTIIHRDDDDEDFEGRVTSFAVTGEAPSRTLRVELTSGTRSFDVEIVEGQIAFDDEGDVLGFASLLIALDRNDVTVRMEGDGAVQDGGATLAMFVKVETDEIANGSGGEDSSDDDSSGHDSSDDDLMGEVEFRGEAILISSSGTAPARTVRLQVTGELNGDARVWLVDLIEGETRFDAGGDFLSVGSLLSALGAHGVVGRFEGEGTMGAEAVLAGAVRAELD